MLLLLEPERQFKMPDENNNTALILVVDDEEQTRDGIEILLKSDGYRVETARNEEYAVRSARRDPPNLILMSPGEPEAEVIEIARHIRKSADLSEITPIVIFCAQSVAEGEAAISGNIHLIRPDNFDQLRGFIDRLLGVRFSQRRESSFAAPAE